MKDSELKNVIKLDGEGRLANTCKRSISSKPLTTFIVRPMLPFHYDGQNCSLFHTESHRSSCGITNNHDQVEETVSLQRKNKKKEILLTYQFQVIGQRVTNLKAYIHGSGL